MTTDIPYYLDFISPALLTRLIAASRPVVGVPDLREVGTGGGFESPEAFSFLCRLYDVLREPLNQVLTQRTIDRTFIDQRTRACYLLNKSLQVDFLDPNYRTIIGEKDAEGRVVMGPLQKHYASRGTGKAVAAVPRYLQGRHVTLFGPPDDKKMAVNAMNAFHRRLKDEPPVVEEILAQTADVPKWGADDEDSKTPLRQDLAHAGENLSDCLSQTIHFADEKTGKTYQLAEERLARPIKRFPGLALPCSFLFYRGNPLPLHLYDFALHLFKNWQNEEALAFYVPKLENEEEARYIHLMVETAEKMLQAQQPSYQVGSIRLFIVLENPRAVFRLHEIMDVLHPYFAGASLGWHDFLASTARVFKEDPHYRIPVKADPDIVIKYIKASHELLAEVVGPRGGIKIGGMYGILPMDNDLRSPSFQITIKGFIKDVITQMKRGLTGFWVAHPDFVRLGMALVAAWEKYAQGEKESLERLVKALLNSEHQQNVLEFIAAADIKGLDVQDPLYGRSLIVADLKESNFIANNHPDEIRYNVFQSLQYLTDWLSGNGCVALPAEVSGVAVRVMDDLATAERSRWEVWHEIYHGRFALTHFLKIVHEEMLFIRKDLSNTQKIVQVKWDQRTAKWYPVAMQIMIKLMTAETPPEFASELLLPFTVPEIRDAADPWAKAMAIDPDKYCLDPFTQRFHHYFSICGNEAFAQKMAAGLTPDLAWAKQHITGLSLAEIVDAAHFHGNIGESPKTLDETAAREQSLVTKEEDATKEELRRFGADYQKTFGVKFLVSAKGRSGKDLLAELKTRLKNSAAEELENAQHALWEISEKRLKETSNNNLVAHLTTLLQKHQVVGAAVSITTAKGREQTLCLGERIQQKAPVTANTYFEIASLSKTLASAFALEYFRAKGIPLHTSVNELFEKTSSSFRLQAGKKEHAHWEKQVTLAHLMQHRALNMHYVNGIPADQKMPAVQELLSGNTTYGYEAVQVIHEPGTVFQYSGGGFLVLEHLIESLEGKKITALTADFFKRLGLKNLTFDPTITSSQEYAYGYEDSGRCVAGTRKMFPSFAAGAVGTASDVAFFLSHLAGAYHSLDGSGGISHDTAVTMLDSDSSSQEFMGVNAGLGVFTADAGPNRLMIHQGANDGFRCLYVHCYDGPNSGAGFVILCNADTRGVLFVAEAAQEILRRLNWEGVNTAALLQDFNAQGIPPEQVVNLGYKKLIFQAFIADRAEEIIPGPRDPLAEYNLAADGKILQVSNDRFARAENLLSPYEPVFDAKLYGRQGKIMDSWESVRHNQHPSDTLIFEIKKPQRIHFVRFSTAFHHGNHPEAVQLEGQVTPTGPWQTIVPKIKLGGHALTHVRSVDTKAAFCRFKVSMFPDGGLSRLALFGDDLPAAEKQKFLPPDQVVSLPYENEIPKPTKPMTLHYEATAQQIERNWHAVKAGSFVDIACSAFGGKVLHASNQHYGPAAQVISPFAPLHMFDGFESARSRTPGHYEELVIELGKVASIHHIDVDFTYFRNNNPLCLEIHGLAEQGTWLKLIEKRRVKGYAGNAVRFTVERTENFSQVKVLVFPDGGMHRVRVFTEVSKG